ncbi:MAG TPA: hypothetical protein VIF15_13325 [Polyangiaceae bacterium]
MRAAPALACLLLACGGRTTSAPPGDAGPDAPVVPAQDADVAPDADTDGGACTAAAVPEWTLSASSFGQGCHADTDCEAVYLGGNACESGSHCACPNASIAVAGDATYRAAADAIRKSPSCQACTPPGAGFGCDCPAPKVYCASGTCAVCVVDGGVVFGGTGCP